MAPEMLPLPPGSVIGMLGGGQLGRMMALAAARVGLSVHVFCPDPESPAFDVAKAHLLRPGDRAALRLAQPLRVARGGIDLTLPVAYDYETGTAAFGRRTSDLAPTGRELVVEASYGAALFGGDLLLNTWWRKDPGHIAAMPDDRGAALRFTMGF